jgi:hypothetical protein
MTLTLKDILPTRNIDEYISDPTGVSLMDYYLVGVQTIAESTEEVLKAFNEQAPDAEKVVNYRITALPSYSANYCNFLACGIALIPAKK